MWCTFNQRGNGPYLCVFSVKFVSDIGYGMKVCGWDNLNAIISLHASLKPHTATWCVMRVAKMSCTMAFLRLHGAKPPFEIIEGFEEFEKTLTTLERHRKKAFS